MPMGSAILDDESDAEKQIGKEFPNFDKDETYILNSVDKKTTLAAQKELDALQAKVSAMKASAPAGWTSPKQYHSADDESVWSHTTLADVLARLRQLESIVSTLLLVNNLKVPTQSVDEVKKDVNG